MDSNWVNNLIGDMHWFHRKIQIPYNRGHDVQYLKIIAEIQNKSKKSPISINDKKS
jgi:hypothetical protein